jgi:hypothetical protein
MGQMSGFSTRSAAILGLALLIGLIGLGAVSGEYLLRFKRLERTVQVKGLAEEEHPADIVIWPIKFTRAANSLPDLFAQLKKDTTAIKEFLGTHGIADDEFQVLTPEVTDKVAQNYNSSQLIEFRYAAEQRVSVYSKNVDTVRAAMKDISVLGTSGIPLTGNEYEVAPQYIFTRLNEVKPGMIEQATRNARAAADKFAADSGSAIGEIKRANQGQFSITDRDQSTPYIKKVRVVTTIEYYLE